MDMDVGVKLMEQYISEFARQETEHLELVNAEKLFELPITDYSDFIRIKKDFEGMQSIYKLYRQQKIARENWSKTLWSKLNPVALTDGIDNFLKDFRKMPRWIRLLPIGQMLDVKMKQFKNSVPLMVSLKNEALRERHWTQLMEQTGQKFDMAADVFTLENMFAMELHKYQEIAETIINNAVKELAIEQGVIDIGRIWEEIAFTVHKHMKGTEERGFVLGSVEEIALFLDDHCMTLQGMVASQFIGPFFESVQKWERTLSLVSETIDEWISTQRKWLYLEGIFMACDIRSQLPEEAKKFEEIDNKFRKVGYTLHIYIVHNFLILLTLCFCPPLIDNV